MWTSCCAVGREALGASTPGQFTEVKVVLIQEAALRTEAASQDSVRDLKGLRMFPHGLPCVGPYTHGAEFDFLPKQPG